MKPMGRRTVKFPGKIDHHPPKGYINWWEYESSVPNKKRERQEIKKNK